MSVKIMSVVFDSKSLKPTERLIMLALADHADDEGRCYPSINRLCQRTGLKERAVQTNIRKLEEQGYLRIHEGAGRNGSNLYFVHPTPAADAPPQEMHPALDAPPPRIICGSDPAADAPKPSGTIIEPSNKDQSAPDPTFSRFWEDWPLAKVGKKKAQTAFKRLSLKNQEAAIRNVRQWAQSWRTNNPTANDMHPTTYLNGQRWNDEFFTGNYSSSSRQSTDELQRARWKKLANGG